MDYNEIRKLLYRHKDEVEANGKVVEKELSLSKNAINTYSLEV